MLGSTKKNIWSLKVYDYNNNELLIVAFQNSTDNFDAKILSMLKAFENLLNRKGLKPDGETRGHQLMELKDQRLGISVPSTNPYSTELSSSTAVVHWLPAVSLSAWSRFLVRPVHLMTLSHPSCRAHISNRTATNSCDQTSIQPSFVALFLSVLPSIQSL